QATFELFSRDAGEIRDWDQGGKRLDSDPDPLRQLGQRVRRVERGLDHRAETGRRYGKAERAEQSIDGSRRVAQVTQIALDGIEGATGLVDGSDQQLCAVVGHQDFASSF